MRLLSPSHLVGYYQEINRKKCLGYPVSFTDFFGFLVGDTLLQVKNFKAIKYSRTGLGYRRGKGREMTKRWREREGGRGIYR